MPSPPPAVDAAREVVRRAAPLRCAAFVALGAPVLVWAAVSAFTGSLWLPGSGSFRYTLVPVAVLAAFAVFEELSAVARHRGEDADALCGLELSEHTMPGPAGVDVIVDAGDEVLAAVVLGADSPVAVERGRHLAAVTVRRRGVSMRRLLSDAADLGAQPVVAVPRCAPLDVDVAVTHGTVRVVGAAKRAAAISGQPLADGPTTATGQ